MKIFKLITWYPNMVHMVQIYLIFKKSIFVFLNKQGHSFPQIYSKLPLYKMSKKIFLISCIYYILT